MLEELRIRGLGVIDDAVLPLGPGLTAVTGETGAGKTMVVTGLLLLFGGRAEAGRVRSGADQATVDGRLADVDPAVAQRVRDAGGDLDDGRDLALRRVVSSAGRSRAFVGGAPAPVAVLTELSERLIAVHGQADQIRLTRRSDQLAVLDRYGNIAIEAYARAYETWRTAASALADRLARTGELRREADVLLHGIGEIDAAELHPGEDTELIELSTRLIHADGLQAAARQARDALAGDPDDPATDQLDVGQLLAGARRALSHVAGADSALDELATRVEAAAAAVGDISSELRSYAEGLAADPARLEQVQQRRSVLASLIRKYADDERGIDSVLDWAERSRRRLHELDVSDDAIAALTTARDAAAADLVTMARQLTQARATAAHGLSEAATAELAGLAMAGASLDIQVRPRGVSSATASVPADPDPLPIGSDGADDVEFLLTAHAQSPAVPIAKGASGGELSRVMLALEVCLAGTDPVPTMVFDEIDAGVGGRAAVEVGRRLATLARDHQVIVVTHLAQVAAYADRQIVVDKPPVSSHERVTTSDVRIVEGADRVTELARMLAGSGSATARDHAAELLDGAARDRAAESPGAARFRSTRTKKAKSGS